MKIHCQLKSLTTADLDQVQGIEGDSLGTAIERDQIKKMIMAGGGDTKSLSIAAQHDHGIIAGYSIYKIRRNHLYIVTLAVRPDYRSLGVGTQIVDHIKSIAEMRDRREVVVLVSQSNYVAHKFFDAMRFVVDKSLDNELSEHGECGVYRFRFNPHPCTVDLKNRITG